MDGTGQFGFIADRGWMDCSAVERDGRTRECRKLHPQALTCEFPSPGR